MTFITKTKAFILEHNLIKLGDTVLVGLSGGPDSVALLSLLNNLRHSLGIHLWAAHINHGLRKSASADQSFAIKLCSAWNIPIICKTVRIPLSKRGIAPEEAAREKRLKALLVMAKQKKANAIALAHHKNDQAETVLMRIIRGTGLLGLRAIAPARRVEDIWIIRPLLSASKEEILNYLNAKKIKFRVDATNRNEAYFRNRIRKTLLPLLKKEFNPGIVDALATLAETSGADYELIGTLAQKIFNNIAAVSGKNVIFPLKNFLSLKTSEQKMLIRLAYKKLKGDTRRLTFAHLKTVEQLTRDAVHYRSVPLPANIIAQRTSEALILCARKT